MGYAVQHASASRTLAKKGAAVTFTLSSPGTPDPATDTYGDPVVTTVSGLAIRTKGDPKRYEALSLVQSESPMLVFTPTTRGESPPLNSTVSWGGVTFTARDAEPVDPDGRGAVIWHVIVSR